MASGKKKKIVRKHCDSYRVEKREGGTSEHREEGYSEVGRSGGQGQGQEATSP